MKRKKDPIMKMVNIRVTQRQHDVLTRHAWDTNQSVAKIIRDVLERQKLIPSSVENNA